MRTQTQLQHTTWIFLLHKVVIWSTSLYFVIQKNPFESLSRTVSIAVIDNYTRWDSLWYTDIASMGYYKEQAAAFFPLYPWTMDWITTITGLSYRVSGLIVSNIAFFIALFFLIRLVQRDFSETIAIRTGFLIAFFPTAFYFSAVYTESLFLMWTVLSFYMGRSKRFWWAGIFGGVASLTRNTGILLVLPLLYEYMQTKQWNWRAIRADIASIALVPAGLLVYMVHLWLVLGDPLAFVHAQKYWSRRMMMPWQTLWNGFIDKYYDKRTQWGKINHIFDKVVVVLELVTTSIITYKAVQRRWNTEWSYILYAAPAVLVPLTSPSIPFAFFLSIPRFVVVIFPLFIFWALWLKNKYLFTTWMVLSIGGLTYLVMKFSLNAFVY